MSNEEFYGAIAIILAIGAAVGFAVEHLVNRWITRNLPGD